MDQDKLPPRSEFNLLGLRLDRRATIIIIVTTLLLMVDHYHRFLPGSAFAGIIEPKALERIILYLIVPLFIILIVFRDRPSWYGFSIGNWRQGIPLTLLFVAIAAPILYVASRTPAMISYYENEQVSAGGVILNSALDLVGWEFVFRGFLLFGLWRVAGPNALLLQAVPFALAHMGKPELETLSTIFGGTLFGLLAWKGRSFLYPFLAHLFVSVFVVLVASGIFAR